MTDCDSPTVLVDATFAWIAANVRDEVDFVVWTGDSARHDSDEKIPRTAKQIVDTNIYIAEKFAEVFGNGQQSTDGGPADMAIPVIPSIGNNDILPHNIFLPGPNKWLKTYGSVWRRFIPEAQRHSFQQGGWFYVEAVPGKLAVFSLNTMYFFDRNSGVDGCSRPEEPGFEHMEWLGVQLQMLRERGMKAILTGHVPPARTPSKQLWDETCWQKYTLWLQQFRDVVVGGMYGHMNIDHFMLQDTKDVDILSLQGEAVSTREYLGDDLSVTSAGDYLEELRTHFSDLPNPFDALGDGKDSAAGGKKGKKGRKGRKKKKERALKKIGGEWAERFQLSNVGPSVVPNYFPTLRVVEYNITGLDTSLTWASQMEKGRGLTDPGEVRRENFDSFNADQDILYNSEDGDEDDEEEEEDVEVVDSSETDSIWDSGSGAESKDGKKKKKKKKPHKPDIDIPLPPSASAPPGPAYSPQPLTLTGYTQYFANLTAINGLGGEDKDETSLETREKSSQQQRAKFKYEVEYCTFNDSRGFKLEDLTVRSYLKLAHRIGRYRKPKGDTGNAGLALGLSGAEGEGEDVWDADGDEEASSVLGRLREIVRGFAAELRGFWDGEDEDEGEEVRTGVEPRKKRRKGHRKGHDRERYRHGRNRNKAWRVFVERAFVGTLDEDELNDFAVRAEERRGEL